ncbi:uncharacterized protein MELLADRAFT_102800 [Melampsora larici-populina 98AG31]|uniref:Uncharacterized protein n=1 Tax=Melampsora larici-populina (strain 98AG31 / pathotype 3-4-7) TaxID=747676 RepID=F4R9E9_MELLP|nr:uncharacterized protein MELLADRAFT_102800 [Melampsora larici-populina 98AG31]EGG11166.1 hypothetical protein MELLADRAFT_102800 [Melampsora larici-populina 98AG31]
MPLMPHMISGKYLSLYHNASEDSAKQKRLPLPMITANPSNMPDVDIGEPGVDEPQKRVTKTAPLTAEEHTLDDSDDEPPHRIPSLDASKDDSQSYHKATKRCVTKAAPLTAEERALDNSDDDSLTTTATPATQGGSKRGVARSTLSHRGLEPLPSIDPSHVHSKEHKHALAWVIQQGNKTRLKMVIKASAVHQQLESTQIKADQEFCKVELYAKVCIIGIFICPTE